jgi:methanethiol S-methyltransferase
MAGFLSLLYGTAAYMVGLAALLYFIGFSGNLLGPKSVDLGGEASWGHALVTNLLLLTMFGIQHSVMARQGFKRWWTRLVPPAVERSTYLVATSAALALMFWLWLPITEPVVWQVNHGAGVALLWGLFALGWLLVLVSSFQIDHFELFGLRQVVDRLRRRNAPEIRFRTPLLYRFVRHPLYAGLLLGLWCVSVMTAGRLLFALGLSAYILIGIAFEERDLVQQFGDRYRSYREQIGMLFPRARAARQAAINHSENTQ